jgi:regulator of protease activity HflC (stomatin/prohibitin superfamily)
LWNQPRLIPHNPSLKTDPLPVFENLTGNSYKVNSNRVSHKGEKMKTIVNSKEFGLLFNKQIFVKVLESGEYKFHFQARQKSIVIVNRKQTLESKGIDVKAINNPLLNEAIETILVKENEVVFHLIDGLFQDVLVSGSHSYFKTNLVHTFIKADPRKLIVPEEIDPSIFESKSFLEQNQSMKLLSTIMVEEGFVGILKVNGQYKQTLAPGKHVFFSSTQNLNVKMIQTRQQTVQISGQELLTKDKVTLRMNFILNYKIVDTLKAALDFSNFEEQLYLVIQLALREYISTTTLDELLAEKHEVGKIILDIIKPKENDFGSIFQDAGIKDVILPGEIRDILNTILIAEKKAMANVITRREETASTRSLLNTAKLMEENSTLYKLKELEYLDHIFEKVGSISLSSNGSMLEQLTEILRINK